MNQETYNVVVLGGGGAGLNIAGLLAENVGKVCLIDSKADLLNVSFHTLGSFIDRERHGLSEKIIASYITELCFHSKHIHTSKKGKAFILNKTQIHRELLERAISRNVAVKTKTTIREFSRNEDGTINSIIDAQGNIYKAKIFIDATGVAGFFSKKLGLQETKTKIAAGLEYNVLYHGLQQQIHLFIGRDFRGGYGWVFPLGQSRAILGYGTIGLANTASMKNTLDRICTIEPIKALVTKDNDKPYGGTIPITDVKTRFVYKNVLCVGDSVSQVHPLVGEGYRFILEAGLIAAPYIIKALERDNLEDLLGYQEEWKRVFYESYRKGVLRQKIAEFASKSDFLSDVIAILVKTLSDGRFQRAIAGSVKNFPSPS